MGPTCNLPSIWSGKGTKERGSQYLLSSGGSRSYVRLTLVISLPWGNCYYSCYFTNDSAPYEHSDWWEWVGVSGRHLICSSKDGLFPDLWVGMWCSVKKRGLMSYDLKLPTASYTLTCNVSPLFRTKCLLNVYHNIQSYYANLNQAPSSFQNSSIILGLCCQGWS